MSCLLQGRESNLFGEAMKNVRIYLALTSSFLSRNETLLSSNVRHLSAYRLVEI